MSEEVAAPAQLVPEEVNMRILLTLERMERLLEQMAETQRQQLDASRATPAGVPPFAPLQPFVPVPPYPDPQGPIYTLPPNYPQRPLQWEIRTDTAGGVGGAASGNAGGTPMMGGAGGGGATGRLIGGVLTALGPVQRQITDARARDAIRLAEDSRVFEGQTGPIGPSGPAEIAEAGNDAAPDGEG